LQSAKATFGSDISSKDVLLHHQGFQILRKLIDSDESILDKDYDEVKIIIDKELDKYTITQTNNTIA